MTSVELRRPEHAAHDVVVVRLAPLGPEDERGAQDSVLGAVKELVRESAVRNVLLSKFSDNVIATGDPMWMLNERLVPVYLHHRWAIEAAIKAVGGMNYTFALRGDTQTPTTIVDPVKQRQALSALLATMQPKELAVPERILAKLPPSPYGLPRPKFRHFAFGWNSAQYPGSSTTDCACT